MIFGSLLLLAVTLLLLLRQVICENVAECPPHILKTNRTLVTGQGDEQHPFLRQRMLSEVSEFLEKSLEGQPAAALNAAPQTCTFASDCSEGMGCLRKKCGDCRKPANCRQNSILKWVCDKSGGQRTCVECTESDQWNCKGGSMCVKNKCVSAI